MAFKNILASAALLAASLFAQTSSAATSLPSIKTVGSKFFTADGDQFYIKGVAYQLSEDDPLLDLAQCSRDAALMKTLGANAIRVYHVDPSQDHTGCMSAFADVGIYLFVDLDTFTTAIDPLSSTGSVWTQSQFNAFSAVMDEFQKYSNTAGFFVGNEVISKANQSNAAPYIKAAARDMKSYRDQKSYRNIPIGYCAADIAELRPMLQNYLACGTNTSEAIDFFGLNAYEWCGQSSFTVSGYNTLTTQAQDYNIPIFFAETGCNTAPPRTFEDQDAILGPDMNSIWSGAIIYEWIQEQNDYGLIAYGPTAAATASGGGVVRSGTPTPVQPDFSNLAAVWSTLTPTGMPSSAYSPSLSAPACPASTASGWLVQGNVQLPSIGQTLQASGGVPTSTPASTSVSAMASPTGTKGSGASAVRGGSREVWGMVAGLGGVLVGVMWFL